MKKLLLIHLDLKKKTDLDSLELKPGQKYLDGSQSL